MATIGVEIDVCLDTLDSNVTETVILEFDNKDQDTLGTGCEFVEGTSIYQNVGDPIVIPTYDSGDTYLKGDLVFTGDGEDPEVDRVHIITATSGDVPKQPESYDNTDDSLDHEDWQYRYMKFQELPAGASYNETTFNIASLPHATDITFSADGTQMYLCDSTDNKIYQYTLDTPWLISTASYNDKFLSTQGGYSIGIAISSDGMKFYDVDNGSRYIYQYNLTEAYNISTATYNQSFALADGGTTVYPASLVFKSDGSKFYVTDLNYDRIYQYDIETGHEWDISTAGKEKYISASNQFSSALAFGDNGTKMYEASDWDGVIYQYNLTSAWDIATADKQSSTLTMSDGYYDGIFFSSDGSKIYHVDRIYDVVRQWFTYTPWSIGDYQASVFPVTRSEVRGDYKYFYEITESGGDYTFATTKCPYPDIGVPCNPPDTWTPMTAHTFLDAESDEPKPIIGSWSGSWVGKTLVIRPNALYIRTTTNAAIEEENVEFYSYSVLELISTVGGFLPVRYSNRYRPFDGTNITPAISTSPMTYTVHGKGMFNSFTLAKILATSVDYIFRLPVDDDNYVLWLDGVEVGSGGNGIVKMDTVAIDCRRDCDSILALYPTTIILYADYQMPVTSSVEVIITHTDAISLGDFTLNNSLVGGFTNMEFTHSLQDFNDYSPDQWGNIPQSVKAVVTKFNITVDIYLEHYDHCVALNESIAGKYVTIDASDSQGEASDSLNVFSSLIRRVRITSATSKSIVKDGELWRMAGFNINVQEIV